MQAATTPSFSAHLTARINTVFKKLDTKGEGKITKQQFGDYVMGGAGIGKCPEVLLSAYDEFDLDKDGFISESEFKLALGNITKIQYGNYTPTSLKDTLNAEGEALKKLQHLQTKDLSETVHKVDVRLGDTSSIKTKLEFKYLLHGADEAKHSAHISKNLHFSEESIGIIFRIHANDPRTAAEKISALIDNGKEMASAFLPPDSPPMKILNAIDIEVSNDDAVVSLGIKVKDDCDNVLLLATLVTMEKYYHHFQQYVHLGVELKHDLHSLLGEPMPLANFITDGFWAFGHLKTNYADFYKTMSEKMLAVGFGGQFAPLNSLIQLFLQKNFNLSLTLPELKLESIFKSIGIPSDALAMDTSIVQMMAPQLAGPIAPMIQNPPNEMAESGISLLKDNLRCNFSLSFKIAEAIFTIHFKTGGVKELVSLATGL